MAEPNELIFSVEWYSSCLHELDGDAYDDQQEAEEIGPDFATLDEAAAWVRERAASDRLDVFRSTR